MHTFRTGKFQDLTIEQAMLRDAPHLYQIMDWTKDEDITRLKNALQDFDILRKKPRQVRVTKECAQKSCHRTPRSMTFPIDKEGCERPAPYYWCDKHDPWERSGISEKYPIHFDVIRLMNTKYEKKSIFEQIKIVIGIVKGTRITREFARKFFAELE